MNRLFLNSLISIVSEFGIYICILIGLWMTNAELGMTALGLYVVRFIAEIMIRRENAEAIRKLYEQAERLDE